MLSPIKMQTTRFALSLPLPRMNNQSKLLLLQNKRNLNWSHPKADRPLVCIPRLSKDKMESGVNAQHFFLKLDVYILQKTPEMRSVPAGFCGQCVMDAC